MYPTRKEVLGESAKMGTVSARLQREETSFVREGRHVLRWQRLAKLGLSFPGSLALLPPLNPLTASPPLHVCVFEDATVAFCTGLAHRVFVGW